MSNWTIMTGGIGIPHIYIYRNTHEFREYLCPDEKVHRSNWDGSEVGTEYYFKTREEAEQAIKIWIIQETKMNLNERLGRAIEAMKVAELTIKKIKQEIQGSIPELKHGDVIKNSNNYYFLWLKDDGQLRMVNTLHIMPATLSKQYEEGDKEHIVGNIFDGFNPWMEKKK